MKVETSEIVTERCEAGKNFSVCKKDVSRVLIQASRIEYEGKSEYESMNGL